MRLEMQLQHLYVIDNYNKRKWQRQKYLEIIKFKHALSYSIAKLSTVYGYADKNEIVFINIRYCLQDEQNDL